MAKKVAKSSQSKKEKERKKLHLDAVERKILKVLKDNPSYPDAAREIASLNLKFVQHHGKAVERTVVLQALINYANVLLGSLKDGAMGTSPEFTLVKRQIELSREGMKKEMSRLRLGRVTDEEVLNRLYADEFATAQTNDFTRDIA